MGKKFNIGPKIVLDGEKEYKKAVSDINSAMKLMNSEMKKAAAEFSDNGKSLKALKTETQLYSEKVNLQEEKVRNLAGALENAEKEYGKNSDEAKKWAISLNNAEADLSKMLNKLDDLKKQSTGIGKIKTVFDNLKSSIADIKEKLSPITDGLKKVGSAASSVAKVSFKAVAAGVAAVGTAAVAAGKKLYDMANEAASAGDAIDKQSQKVGLSAASYQKWDYVMNLAGTSMQDCTVGMKTLTNQIDQAKNGSTKAIETFSRLGISASELNKMNREDAFEKVISSLQGMKDSTERAAIANTLFGKSGQNLTPLFNQSAEATKELMENAEKCGMIMSNDAVNASAKWQDSLTTLKSTVSGLKNGLVSNLLPGMTMVTDGLTKLISGQKGAKESIVQGIKDATDSLQLIFPKLTEVFGTVITAITEIAPQIIGSLVEGLVTNLNPLLDAAMSIISSLASSLLEENNLNTIIKAAVSLITQLVSGLVNNIELIIDACITIITALTDALTEDGNMQKVIDAAFTIIMKLSEAMLELVPQLIDCGFQLIAGLVKGIWDNRDRIWTTIKNIGKTLLSTFTSLMGINSPSTVFAGYGKNLIQGLINGIDNVKGWLREKIRSLGTTIISTAKDILGIHSPSTEFEALGDFSGQGYGVGFIKSMKRVKELMKASIPTSIDSDVGVRVKNSINTVRNELSDPIPTSGRKSALSYEKIKLYVTLHIDKFVNSAESDIDELVDIISEKLYTKIKRKMEAFA